MPAAPLENTKLGSAVDWGRTKIPIKITTRAMTCTNLCVYEMAWLGDFSRTKLQRFVGPVDLEATSRFRSFSETAFHTLDAHILISGIGVAISPSAKLGDKDERSI